MGEAQGRAAHRDALCPGRGKAPRRGPAWGAPESSPGQSVTSSAPAHREPGSLQVAGPSPWPLEPVRLWEPAPELGERPQAALRRPLSRQHPGNAATESQGQAPFPSCREFGILGRLCHCLPPRPTAGRPVHPAGKGCAEGPSHRTPAGSRAPRVRLGMCGDPLVLPRRTLLRPLVLRGTPHPAVAPPPACPLWQARVSPTFTVLSP